MVPSNVLQKAGGPGRPVRVGMASWEPLRSGPPDALQGPFGLTQPLSRTAAGIKELRAGPLWRGREKNSSKNYGYLLRCAQVYWEEWTGMKTLIPCVGLPTLQ